MARINKETMPWPWVVLTIIVFISHIAMTIVAVSYQTKARSYKAKLEAAAIESPVSSAVVSSWTDNRVELSLPDGVVVVIERPYPLWFHAGGYPAEPTIRVFKELK